VNAGASQRWRRWLPWLGAFIGVAVLAWLLRRFDFDRFFAILADADVRYIALVPLAIAAEQLVRGWKWRQILYPLRPVGTLPLFGAIMAGYLLGLLIPFGFGALARSWLVARREGMPISAVLATAALDRLTDGVVFAGTGQADFPHPALSPGSGRAAAGRLSRSHRRHSFRSRVGRSGEPRAVCLAAAGLAGLQARCLAT
jgi:hypothetical protein